MTENTNTKRNERLKPCGCSWCIAAQRRDRMEMGGMVIAPCDEYGRTDREAMAAVGLAVDDAMIRKAASQIAYQTVLDHESCIPIARAALKAATVARRGQIIADAKRAELEGQA